MFGDFSSNCADKKVTPGKKLSYMTEFSNLGLDPSVLSAVEAAGYEKPTPIQIQAIPPTLEGRDLLGIAQTGTGKTASFVLPMINALIRGRAKARMPRSLVLTPTRELATQVSKNFTNYSIHSNLSMALLIGGVSFTKQIALIDRGVDVLIATPGRLLDLFERGRLLLSGVQIVTIDEADRMLDMGFIPDIERILQLTPFTRQTLFFSATMPPEIERITNVLLSNPVRVEVTRRASVGANITQIAVIYKTMNKRFEFKEKRQLLRQTIKTHESSIINGIIFCNRKADIDTLLRSMRFHKIDCTAIHGDLDQSLRTKVLNDFRNGTKRFLIASDVAARGLDIPLVSHVINFDMPVNPEDYVHRIGRTGRAGRNGIAITFVNFNNIKSLNEIESLMKSKITHENHFEKKAATTAEFQNDRSQQLRPKNNVQNKINSTSKTKKRTPTIGMGDHTPAFLTTEFTRQSSV